MTADIGLGLSRPRAGDRADRQPRGGAGRPAAPLRDGVPRRRTDAARVSVPDRPGLTGRASAADRAVPGRGGPYPVWTTRRGRLAALAAPPAPSRARWTAGPGPPPLRSVTHRCRTLRNVSPSASALRPPITTISGSSSRTAGRSASARYVATASTATAASSSEAASRAISSSVGGCAKARAVANTRRSPCSARTVWRQPRRPHVHGSPPSTAGVCAMSPPRPLAPVQSWPWVMIAHRISAARGT